MINIILIDDVTQDVVFSFLLTTIIAGIDWQHIIKVPESFLLGIEVVVELITSISFMNHEKGVALVERPPPYKEPEPGEGP